MSVPAHCWGEEGGRLTAYGGRDLDLPHLAPGSAHDPPPPSPRPPPPPGHGKEREGRRARRPDAGFSPVSPGGTGILGVQPGRIQLYEVLLLFQEAQAPPHARGTHVELSHLY